MTEQRDDAADEVRQISKAEQLQRFSDDTNKARELAEKDPGTHVWVNGVHTYKEPPTLFESLFGFRLF